MKAVRLIAAELPALALLDITYHFHLPRSRSRGRKPDELSEVGIPYLPGALGGVAIPRAKVKHSLKKSVNDYHVGIVCALPLEAAAMVAMLDEEHTPPSMPRPRGGRRAADPNKYHFGEIVDHNIVIACLPGGSVGEIQAASVANHLSRSFDIRYALMVGIGGGIRSPETDLRLGDVVVSQPTGVHGGVFRWDLGKVEKGGEFHRFGSINRPPPELLSALSFLQTRYRMQGSKLRDNLVQAARKFPAMIDDLTHPGLERDVLFENGYEHAGGATCRSCDQERAIKRRPARTALEPKIWYGNIASGNSVVKDWYTREHLRREGAICVEMEAAGVDLESRTRKERMLRLICPVQ